MNTQRIIEILETYRPGEGLEADPEVVEALDLVSRDPELSALRESIGDFDRAFTGAVRSAEVPADLQERILAGPREQRQPDSAGTPDPGKIIRWAHPAALAAAAAIILFLALSFTFWNRPGAHAPQSASFAGPGDLMATADRLYASLNPSFKSARGDEILQFLQSRGGAIPASMPGAFTWDHSFACDVIHIDGATVSIVCFKSPETSDTLHLFTFRRSEFPGFPAPASPKVRSDGKSCCATWAQGELIHVLYSDKGEEKLRQLLEI